MENLKNIKNFKEFKDSVNEELLWNAVKNLLGTLFGKMDKRFSESINNFTKKIDGTKTWEEAVKFMEQSNGDVRDKFQEGLKTVTGPLGLRKLLADVSETIFTELQVIYNRYGQKEATPRKIFEGTPNAQMFAFDKAKDFKDSLFNTLNAKILDMSKDSYNPQELQKYLTDHKNIDETEPFAPTNASFIYKFTDKLNEFTESGAFGGDNPNFAKPKPAFPAKPADPADPNAKPAEPADPNAKPADPADPNAKPADPNAKPADPNAKQDPNAVPKGDSAKLAQATTTWINEQLLGVSLKKLQGLKPPTKVGQEDAFTAISKNTKVTNNPESVAKLLRNIVNLPPEKKGELTQIRDILAKALDKNPEDLKNEIPL